jgi:hypothetical protein
VVLLASAIGVFAPLAGSAAQSDVDRLIEVEHQRLQALVNADVSTARKLHADDFQLVNPLGGTLTKDQYLAQIVSGEIDYLQWDPGDIAVKIYGNAAVIRYKATLRIKVKAIPDAPSGEFWHIDLYEKRGGVWQVVWSQATQIL